MQQHSSKYFACRSPPPSPDHGVWVQYVKIHFLEQGPDAYQIKGNYKCNNMVANNLPADTPTPSDLGWGQWVKIQHFPKLIMLHIKLNENTKCNKMVSNILPPDPPDPRSLKVKIQLVLNMVMLHIKLNGIKKCSNMVANILPPYPPDPREQQV